jgi:phosphate-selective porin OprO and OprP
MIIKTRLICYFILLFGITFQSGASGFQQDTVSAQIQEKNSFKQVWDLLKLYRKEENSVIQEFSIIGRYHGQVWSVNSHQGSAGGWENRRFYIGAEAVLLHNFEIQAQIKISENFNPIYEGLYQANIKWSPVKEFSLSIGRLDFLYGGLERTVSSTKIVTFERGQLVNQLWPAEVVGIVAQGESGKLSYRAGVLSGTIGREFSDFSGGFGAVAGVGYSLPLFFREGSLHLDYLYNDGNSANNALKAYKHILSLWHHGQTGPFGLGLDLTVANETTGNNSVIGVTVMPTYVFWKEILRNSDALEGVLRYQFATSKGTYGLDLQSRYEQKVVNGGLGNRYNAVFAGINYLIYENMLKLMTGIEYSIMKATSTNSDTFNGWTYFAGVRVYF